MTRSDCAPLRARRGRRSIAPARMTHAPPVIARLTCAGGLGQSRVVARVQLLVGPRRAARAGSANKRSSGFKDGGEKFFLAAPGERTRCRCGLAIRSVITTGA